MLRSIIGSAVRTVAFTAARSGTGSNRSFVVAAASTAAKSLLPRPILAQPTVPHLQWLQQLAPIVPLQTPICRSVTKFSLVKGKRKTVRAVLKRFKRLHWGCWIRTHCGRNKKMFKKSPALKRRLRQHVFTNSTQSWLLDKMVTSYWRRAKHYVDDPYTPYHTRDEYFATAGKRFKV